MPAAGSDCAVSLMAHLLPLATQGSAQQDEQRLSLTVELIEAGADAARIELLDQCDGVT